MWMASHVTEQDAWLPIQTTVSDRRVLDCLSDTDSMSCMFLHPVHGVYIIRMGSRHRHDRGSGHPKSRIRIMAQQWSRTRIESIPECPESIDEDATEPAFFELAMDETKCPGVDDWKLECIRVPTIPDTRTTILMYETIEMDSKEEDTDTDRGLCIQNGLDVAQLSDLYGTVFGLGEWVKSHSRVVNSGLVTVLSQSFIEGKQPISSAPSMTVVTGDQLSIHLDQEDLSDEHRSQTAQFIYDYFSDYCLRSWPLNTHDEHMQWIQKACRGSIRLFLIKYLAYCKARVDEMKVKYDNVNAWLEWFTKAD